VWSNGKSVFRHEHSASGREVLIPVVRDTVVSLGGVIVSSGGVAFHTTIDNSELLVSLGGVADGIAVGSSGTLYVVGGLARGAVIEGGGSASIYGGGRIAAPVIDGGTVDLERGFRLGGAIDFAGSGGSLVIAGQRLPSPAHVVSGFAPGDTIDLAGVFFTSGGSAALAAGNELQINEGGQTYTLFFDPKQDFSGFVFTWANDGHGGTKVTETAAPAAAASEMRWFGAAPEARPASPHLVDSGSVPGHATPASLAQVSAGGFGHG
jgi:hypothetical protein